MKEIKINESLVVVYNILFTILIGAWIYFLFSQEARPSGATGVEASIGEAVGMFIIACIISFLPIPFTIYFWIVKKHLSNLLFILSQVPFCLSLIFWLTLLIAMTR
jgi:hypothetical protein